MTKKIIFTTGGTGGHILPAINLMKHFQEKGYEVIIVTDIRGCSFLTNHTKFKSYILKTDTPTNKNLLKKIYSFFVIFYSIIKSSFILRKEKPNMIFGFGGYVSFPICFASKIFNLPLIIYENNIVPGKTNNFLSKFSKKIFTSQDIKNNFSEKFKNKISTVGSILNKNIINYSNNIEKKDKNIFSILILGGSQGAEIFGKIIPKAIKMLEVEGYKIEVNQQCIKSQKKELIDFYNNNNIKNNIFEFEDNILKLISSTNLAISRCGASTTSELVCTATPFIAVPLPNSIDNHQYLNAKYYENKGCCLLLEQKYFDTQNLFKLMIEIIKNETKLQNMRKNMKKIFIGDVYNNIEKEIKDFIY